MDKKLKQSQLEWVTNGSEYSYDLNIKFTQGRPAATERYTIEELESMGHVGYYRIKDEEKS